MGLRSKLEDIVIGIEQKPARVGVYSSICYEIVSLFFKFLYIYFSGFQKHK